MVQQVFGVDEVLGMDNAETLLSESEKNTIKVEIENPNASQGNTNADANTNDDMETTISETKA